MVFELHSYNLTVKQVSSLKVLKTLDLRKPPAAFEKLDTVLQKNKTSCMMEDYTGTPLVVQTDGGAKKEVVIAGFVVFLPLG